jgi:transcription elongation GreA/GreB family factor
MIISHTDKARFKRYLDACEQRLLRELDGLEKVRARVAGAATVAAQDVPDDFATMHAQVRLRDLDSGRTLVSSVVLPPEDEIPTSTRSSLSWPAVALLGAREGEEVQLPMRLGSQRVRVEKVLFRPEPAPHRARASVRAKPSAGRESFPIPGLVGPPMPSRNETARLP